MKFFLKSYILKSLLLFLLHNTITESAEITALLIADELVVLTGLGIGIAGQAVSHYVGSFAFIQQQKQPHISTLKRSKAQARQQRSEKLLSVPVKCTDNNHRSYGESEQFVDQGREEKKRAYVEHCVQELYKKSYFTPSPEQLHEVRREAEERFDLEMHHIKEAELPEDALKIATDPLRGGPLSLAPGAEQPIAEIAPPLPPEHDPNKEGKQEQEVLPPTTTGKKVRYPQQEAQLKHNWCKKRGHVEKTPEYEKLFGDVANDPECLFGPADGLPDKNGHYWYGKMLKDGRQAWVEVREEIMSNWGINEPGNIIEWNPITGLKAPKAPRKNLSGRK